MNNNTSITIPATPAIKYKTQEIKKHLSKFITQEGLTRLSNTQLQHCLQNLKKHIHLLNLPFYKKSKKSPFHLAAPILNPVMKPGLFLWENKLSLSWYIDIVILVNFFSVILPPLFDKPTPEKLIFTIVIGVSYIPSYERIVREIYQFCESIKEYIDAFAKAIKSAIRKSVDYYNNILEQIKNKQIKDEQIIYNLACGILCTPNSDEEYSAETKNAAYFLFSSQHDPALESNMPQRWACTLAFTVYYLLGAFQLTAAMCFAPEQALYTLVAVTLIIKLIKIGVFYNLNISTALNRIQNNPKILAELIAKNAIEKSTLNHDCFSSTNASNAALSTHELEKDLRLGKHKIDYDFAKVIETYNATVKGGSKTEIDSYFLLSEIDNAQATDGTITLAAITSIITKVIDILSKENIYFSANTYCLIFPGLFQGATEEELQQRLVEIIAVLPNEILSFIPPPVKTVNAYLLPIAEVHTGQINLDEIDLNEIETLISQPHTYPQVTRVTFYPEAEFFIPPEQSIVQPRI